MLESDNSNPTREFDELEELALDALAQGRTHTEVGALVGRSAKWVQRLKEDEAFRAEARRRRTEQLEAIRGQLGAIGPQAVAAIGDALTSENEPVRLRAALAALKLVSHFDREAELETRISELEQRALNAGTTQEVAK